MLVKLGRISADDVARCTDQFDLLDHHKRGYLARDDVDDDVVRPEVAVEVAEPRAVSFGAAEEPTPLQRFRRAGLAVKAASRIRRASLFQPKPQEGLEDIEEHPP